MGDKVGENPTALRAAVFFLPAKNRKGGVQAPPSRAKVNRTKMKYIDFESCTVTWLHEGNVIVEDQLTHNFKRRSRTAPPKAVFYAAVQNVSRSWK